MSHTFLPLPSHFIAKRFHLTNKTFFSLSLSFFTPFRFLCQQPDLVEEDILLPSVLAHSSLPRNYIRRMKRVCDVPRRRVAFCKEGGGSVTSSTTVGDQTSKPSSGGCHFRVNRQVNSGSDPKGSRKEAGLKVRNDGRNNSHSP